jgi:hypothetical protein
MKKITFKLLNYKSLDSDPQTIKKCQKDLICRNIFIIPCVIFLIKKIIKFESI